MKKEEKQTDDVSHQTSCTSTEGCSVTPTTTTTTITTSETYQTITQKYGVYAWPSEPASQLNAIASSIESEQSARGWLAPIATATATTTSSPGSGSVNSGKQLNCTGGFGPAYPESQLGYAFSQMCQGIMLNVNDTNQDIPGLKGLQLFPLTNKFAYQSGGGKPEVNLGFWLDGCPNDHIPLTQDECMGWYNMIATRCDYGSKWKQGGVLDTGNCMFFNMFVDLTPSA